MMVKGVKYLFFYFRLVMAYRACSFITSEFIKIEFRIFKGKPLVYKRNNNGTRSLNVTDYKRM